MKNIVFLLFLSFSGIFYAQDYKAVDERVKQYPKRITSAEALATQIQKDFKSDKEKVRALYTWLALNIEYDMNEFLNGDRFVKYSYIDQKDLENKQKAVKEYFIQSTLKTNTAICEGFAQTFKRVCDLMNIRCVFVDGYSKTSFIDIGKNPPRPDHAWNAVKLDDKWYVLDVTWASGNARGSKWIKDFDDYFFLTNPDEFVKTHLPSIEGMSFAKNEPSKEEFFKEPIYATPYFKAELDLKLPTTGVLKVKKGHTIKFELGKIKKNVELHYALGYDMKPKPITLSYGDTKCAFEIPFEGNTNTELYIIVDRQSALQFKIRVIK